MNVDLVKRLGVLALIATLAGCVALPITAPLHYLLSGATGLGLPSTLLFGALVWLVLTAAGAVPFLLRQYRAPAHIVVPASIVLALAVCAGIPGAAWWTYGVDHSPRGEPYPSSAIYAFMSSGPLASSWGRSEAEWSRSMCRSREQEIRADVARMVAAIDHGGGGYKSFTQAYYFPPAVEQREEDRATVQHDVSIEYAIPAPEGDLRGDITQRIGVGPWTFHLIKDDGWQVCGIDHPDIAKVLDR